MKLLLIATLIWGPSLYATNDVATTAEVIYPNTPATERNNPSVNPTPDPIDEKNFDQTLKARQPSSDKQQREEEPRYNTTPKPRTSRPLGPNKM